MLDFISTVLIFSVLISVYHYRGQVVQYVKRQAGGMAACHCPECRKRADLEKAATND